MLVDPHASAMQAAARLAASARALVLRAGDPRSAAFARMRPRGASIVHVGAMEAGAACVYWQGDAVMLATADRRIALTERRRMSPAIRTEDALAAIAALWAYGLEERAIAAAVAPRSDRAPEGADSPAASLDRARAAASPSHAHR